MTKFPAFRLSCIIPAYNEGARIGAVLGVVADHPLIDEVVVVDDASTDNTARVAAVTQGVTLIRQPVNGGKTKALIAGFEAMTGSHVLLLDADLIGLTAQDVTDLIAPVREGRADVSISLRGNAPWPWRAIGLDYISGERVMRKDILPSAQQLSNLPNFGFEVFLNKRLVDTCARLAVVPWPAVRSPAKEAKHGFWPGLWADVAMMRDIVRTVPASKLLAQIRAMRKLRVTEVG